MSVAVVVGTRPEIIKMSPVIDALQRRRKDFFLLHTGQHYSYKMDQIFFQELGLLDPEVQLKVGSGSHGAQTGKMLAQIEEVLRKKQPEVVLVEGDTNTVLAGALAAVKLGIQVGHVEAGLRSYDRSMPEEINRIVADRVSDWLFPPTPKSLENLRGEGVPSQKILLTGNTIVDALSRNLKRVQPGSKILSELDIKANEYALLTAHRQENVDDKKRFQGILKGVQGASKTLGVPVLYPIHPRSRKQLETFGLTSKGIHLVDPLGYLEFLQLERSAGLVFTDSGGVQEESCILRIPCVTLRENTERPETIDVGANVLVGTDPNRIEAEAKRMWKSNRAWTHPFGDGRAGERIVEALEGSV